MSRVKSTGNILSRLLSEQAYLKYPRLHPRLSYELVFHLKLFFPPRLLLTSPLVTWLSFVLQYLSTVIYLQRGEQNLLCAYKVE